MASIANERHAEAAIEQIALHIGEGEAVIGGADDERVGAESAAFERVEHVTDALIENAGAGVKAGHIGAGGGGVGHRHGWLDVPRIVVGGGCGVGAVGFEEADVEEEGLGGTAVEEARGGRDVGDAIRLRTAEIVIPDGLGLGGDVLEPAEDRAIAGIAERVENVAAVVGHREAAMCEAEHAVLVRTLSSEQRGATRRGAGCSAWEWRGRKGGDSVRCRARPAACKGATAAACRKARREAGMALS